ncbi:hypothetical protein F4677DRAFT_144362 [Hypoxylon crocopeplum]|nr:hypothetical protein F4677DRAFT_144362 [Hypoxylon crocopeplum]
MAKLEEDIDNFLSAYKENERFYQILAKYAEKRCREILDNNDIKGLVSSRAKEYKSLAIKLPDRARQWASKKNIDINNEINDLAGVRMALYFPDDVPVAAEEVMKRFDTVFSPIVKTAKREDARKPRPQYQTDKLQRADTEKPLRELLPAEYQYGPWRSVSEHEVVHHWKHSGYRAVHLILDLAKTMNEAITTGKSLDRNEGSDTQQDDEFNAEDLQSVLDHKVSKVEVQITTVVMHAWSEVHDIIYKNKYGLPVNSTMNRMLDGINGLSITSEILLEELQKTFNSLRKEDETNFGIDNLSTESGCIGSIPTAHVNTLRSWLERNYVSVEDRWDAEMAFVKPLWVILESPLFRVGNGHQLRNFISQSGIDALRPRIDGKAPMDLSARIVMALSREPIVKKTIEETVLGSESRDSGIGQLYDILLAANAFTIMFAIDGRAAREELSQPGMFSRAELMNFNRMLILIANPQHTEVKVGWVDELATFARKFLEDRDSNIHDISTAFSRLSLFTCVIEDHPLQTVLSRYTRMSVDEMETQHTIDRIIERLLSCSTLVLSDFDFLHAASRTEDQKAETYFHYCMKVGVTAADEDRNRRFSSQITAWDPLDAVGDMAWLYIYIKNSSGTTTEERLNAISIRYRPEIDFEDYYGEPESPRGLSDDLSEISSKTINSLLFWLDERLTVHQGSVHSEKHEIEVG